LSDVIRIDSLDDPRVAAYRDVANPARLFEQSLFVAEGRLVVRRLLDLGQWRIESILLTQPAAHSLEDVLDATDAPAYLVDQVLMNAIAGFNIHRGCLALVRRPSADTLDRIAAGPLARVLVLEGVNNPDNIGGLFRSAAAFDIELVVLGPDCGDPLYRKAVRTSMAATLSVPFVRAPQCADGFTVVALTPQRTASPLDAVFPHSKLALLVGSEGSGLSPEALRAATIRIRIPTTPDVDSLNVTVAASIAMYHCFAERRG
jgi:tRNA G18 (ribose-2'-O)-methylase SpoU